MNKFEIGIVLILACFTISHAQFGGLGGMGGGGLAGAGGAADAGAGGAGMGGGGMGGMLGTIVSGVMSSIAPMIAGMGGGSSRAPPSPTMQLMQGISREPTSTDAIANMMFTQGMIESPHMYMMCRRNFMQCMQMMNIMRTT